MNSSSSFNKFLSITTTLPLSGCIALFISGRVTTKTPTITKLNSENIVSLVGTPAALTAPAVAVTRDSPPVARVNGIDADNPACHNKNPEYAEAIRSL